MKKILLLFAVMFSALCAVGQTVTLDFTANNWGLPEDNANGLTEEKTFTNGECSIKLAASAKYYFNTSIKCLMLGKANSTLSLPAFDFAVEKIVVTGTSGASAAVKQNIFVGEDAVSTETEGAKDVANEYVIAADKQAAGTIYTFKVISSHNTQISKIEVYAAEKSGDDVIDEEIPAVAVPSAEGFAYEPITKNTDLTSEDMSSYHVQGAANPEMKVVDFKNGKAIEVVGGAKVDQAWDTQFFIVFDEPLPVGETVNVSFAYKADVAAKGTTQSHKQPGSWTPNASIGDINFGTEWNTFSGEFEVSNADIQSVAFNLNEMAEANNYYFANVTAYKKVRTQAVDPDAIPAADEIPAAEEGKEWVDVATNDLASTFVQGAAIEEKENVNGVKVFEIVSNAKAEGGNVWDSQFFIKADEAIANGTKYYLSFSYKAAENAPVSLQSHAAPGSYLGGFNPGSITCKSDEWQTCTVVANSTNDAFQSIAFNLNEKAESTTYYIANIVFKVQKDKAEAQPLEMATVTIEKGEKSIVIKSSNAEYALQTKFKPVSELEEGETPESTVTSIIEEMAGAFATAQEFEDYFVSMATKGEKEIDLEGIEEVYPAGTEFFVAACNIAWDPIANKVALASNVAVDTYVIPAAEVAIEGDRIAIPAGSPNGDELTVEVLEKNEEDEILSAKYTVKNGTWGNNASHLSIFKFAPLSADMIQGYEKIVVVFDKAIPASEGEATYGFIPVGLVSPVNWTPMSGLDKWEYTFTDDDKAKGIEDFSLFFNASGSLKDIEFTIKGIYLVKAEGEETAISAVNADAKVGKFLQNGKIVIVKNGKAYNTVGARIK
ncbi:MAG: hypothetical protein MJZ60_04335 [Bacteroidaceae bacterium]|nr:hypothetical protein [Bacteroidaceae bacterium]